MLKSVEISRFRCFEELVCRDLRRVNLVVGLNSAGKTCLLEALEVLVNQSPSSLVSVGLRRGEYSLIFFAGGQQARQQVELQHMFFGRAASVGSRFNIKGTWDNKPSSEVSASIAQASVVPPSLTTQPPTVVYPFVPAEPYALMWTVNGATVRVPMSGSGLPYPLSVPPTFGAPQKLTFVGTGAAQPFELAQVWGAVSARPQEDWVLDALRIVEPDVERLAIGVSPQPVLYVRLHGYSDRIPFGNLGDGASRLLLLSSQLVASEGGFLLVDEIDRGLHVSAMEKMWRLVFETARRLQVQVFATTHSDDCLRGLAKYLESREEGSEDARLLRVQRGAKEAISYGAKDIIRSATANIEVR